jgi:hypothetical protein
MQGPHEGSHHGVTIITSCSLLDAAVLINAAGASELMQIAFGQRSLV